MEDADFNEGILIAYDSRQFEEKATVFQGLFLFFWFLF